MHDEARVTHLRDAYADLSTDTLREMWASEARADWAENLLGETLALRGISRAELEAIAARREEITRDTPPLERDTIWKYGVVGRMAAFGGAFLGFGLLNAAFGPRVGVCAFVVAFALYAFVLIRRAFRQSKFRVAGATTFAMIWQCFEAVILLLFSLVAAYLVLTGNG